MDAKDELIKVFAEMTDFLEMEVFLREIFTPKEMADLYLRWQLLKELHEGKTQRSIAARHRMSLCKITRGSKVLKAPDSVVKKILDKMKEGK
jgi:Trp operon repressor